MNSVEPAWSAGMERQVEHRWGKRVTTNIAVRLIASGGKLGAGRVRDVSASGAFIETPLLLRPLTWVQLEPDRAASGRDTRVRIAGCVVRCTPNGLGIEWCDGSAESVEELCRAISGSSALEPATLREDPRLPVPGRAFGISSTPPR